MIRYWLLRLSKLCCTASTQKRPRPWSFPDADGIEREKNLEANQDVQALVKHAKVKRESLNKVSNSCQCLCRPLGKIKKGKGKKRIKIDAKKGMRKKDAKPVRHSGTLQIRPVPCLTWVPARLWKV